METQEHGRRGSSVARRVSSLCLLLIMLVSLACTTSGGSGPSPPPCGRLTPTPTQGAMSRPILK